MLGLVFRNTSSFRNVCCQDALFLCTIKTRIFLINEAHIIDTHNIGVTQGTAQVDIRKDIRRNEKIWCTTNINVTNIATIFSGTLTRTRTK
ncbi:hypothetical protein Trydic_g22205 [Trypoxylus dichotomus]